MKRFFLILLFFFLLILLSLGIIGFNLDYFLNQDLSKNRIKGYVSRLFDVEIDYKRVHVNLYKLKVEFEGLKAKGKDFELELPKGKIFFSRTKLFSLNFYPSSIYLKNPYFLIRATKEERPFEIKGVYTYLQASSPFTLSINNGTFEYRYVDGKGFQIKGLNLLAKDRAPQVLFDLNATAGFFSRLDFKGRLNYRDEFFEGTLKVKKLDLNRLNNRDLDFLKKTELDLTATLSLEKEVLNIGFTGSAPCLAFNQPGSPFVCGFFQGYFTGNQKAFELRLSPVDMKYPEIKGEVLLQRSNQDYYLEAGIEALSLAHFREILIKILDEKTSQEVFDIVRGGHFEKLSLQAKGKNLEDLINPQNMIISGLVKEGEITLADLPLTATNLEGKVFFEKGRLDFQGSALVEERILAEVKKLDLSLLEKKETLGLNLDFNGEGRTLREVTKRFLEDKEGLDKIDVQGQVRGSLEVSGELRNPEVSLSLRPEKTLLKIEPLKDWLNLKGGEILYQKERIYVRGLEVAYGENLAKGISGDLSLRNKTFSLSGDYLFIKEPLIYELLGKNETLRQFFKDYNIKIDALKLDNLSYQGNIDRLKEENFLDLLKNLSLSGDVEALSFDAPLNNETLHLFSPLLRFSLKENRIKLIEGQVFSENSTLDISGEYDLKESLLSLKGRGLLSKNLIGRLNITKKAPFSLKDLPLSLQSFEFSYSQRDGINYQGRHLIGNLSVEGEIQKKEALSIKAKVSSEKNDFNLEFLSLKDKVDFSYHGLADFKEISSLFEDPLIERGTLKGDFRVGLDLTKKFFARENLSLKKGLSGLMQRFLDERPLSLDGAFEIKDLKVKEGFIITGGFTLLTDQIKGDNLLMEFDNSSLRGDLVLTFGEKVFDLKGNFYVDNLDLKGRVETRMTEEEGPSYQELLRELPLEGELKLEIARALLPTSHEVRGLQARILKNGKVFRVEAPEIQFCRLNFYAEYENNPEFQYLFVDLRPAKGDFLDLFSCLYPEEMPKTIFEGPFEMQGFFYTDGEKGLFENSYGKIEALSDKGYIYRAPLLARVLGFLSPIDLFRGKVPNLENNLLPYDDLNFLGEFRNTSLHLDTFFLSAPGFRLFGDGAISLKDKKIGLTFLVSPFKTVDVILEHIPFINKWALGKERMLIYLPLEVVGTYDNPTIVPLHPASIGKGLFRFIFKFFGIQEEFYKKPETFEGFKKPELFKGKSGDSLRR